MGTATVVSSLSTPVRGSTSSLLLRALKHLLITVEVICLAWPAVFIEAMLTGHTDVLPAIGAVLERTFSGMAADPVDPERVADASQNFFATM